MRVQRPTRNTDVGRYIESPEDLDQELKAEMQKAGVVSKAQISFLKA